eukprot:1160403-Pelagomonas_calceolata.AAC.2
MCNQVSGCSCKRSLCQNLQPAPGRYKRAPIIDTALPPIPTPPRPDALRRVGYITRGYHLDIQPKFAVVRSSEALLVLLSKPRLGMSKARDTV